MSIVAAAIMIHGKIWMLPAPARHGDIIKEYVSFHGNGSFIKAKTTAKDQGFINDKLEFLTRKEAADHVLEIGQKVTKYCDLETLKRCRLLFSEDVW
jgi:hypothetical protein